MSGEGLETFHQLLVRLRSEAISNITNHISGRFKTSRSSEMAEAYEKIGQNPKILEDYFVPEIVDETIIIFLQLLDISNFDVRYVSSSGEDNTSLFESTGSIGANYEFDWLPQIKTDK